jgi:TonB family protein
MKYAAAALLLYLLPGAASGQDISSTSLHNTMPSRAVAGTHNCAQYFPAEARRNNEAGDVMVRYDVRADGTIVNVTLLKTSGFKVLDDAALACVAQAWRNAPALRNGRPIASSDHRAIIRFTLDGVAFPRGRNVNPLYIYLIIAVWLALSAAVTLYLVFGRGPKGAERRCPNCGATVLSATAQPPTYCSVCGQHLPA